MGVAKIVSGTAIGQLIALAAAPILARLYTPADFGVFTVIATIAMTFGAVSALRLDLAIPLPEDEVDAYSLTTLGLIACALMTAFGLAISLLLAESVGRLLGDELVAELLWIAPLTGGVAGVFLILNQLAVRRARFGAIARRNLLQSVATTTIQVGSGFAGARPEGLVLGQLGGQASGAFSLLFGSGLRGLSARKGRQLSALRSNARRYRRFPAFLTFAALCNSLGIQAPIFLIALYYGTEVAGWLGLTQRTLGLPITLVGVSIAQVYVSRLAQARRMFTKNLSALFNMVTKRLAIMSVIIATPLLVLGPELFVLVFGPEWQQSGSFARALAVSLAFQLVASPLSQTLIVLERPLLQLTWDIGRLVVCLLSVIIPAYLGLDALAAVWAFGGANAISYAVGWSLSYRAIKTFDRSASESGPDEPSVEPGPGPR
ncbi:oligosaccharide flippase family protein [Occultella kanbiaonis]|uniref:oligosaccharide flippase family protein n=1 Tax=Occultella kanbiaonis TaxID=2675754 RepID=UPI0013D27F2C|nr:oligosaccharide flippase family protein [Occultella kanbiaonis]